jgi:1,4-alpha-glucan branching enzyme
VSGMTEFTIWAPAAERVELAAAGGRHPMTPPSTLAVLGT